MTSSPPEDPLLDWAAGLADDADRAEIERRVQADPALAERAALLRRIVEEAGALPTPEPHPRVRVEVLRAAREHVPTPGGWLARWFAHPVAGVVGVAALCALVEVAVLRVGDRPEQASPVALMAEEEEDNTVARSAPAAESESRRQALDRGANEGSPAPEAEEDSAAPELEAPAEPSPAAEPAPAEEAAAALDAPAPSPRRRASRAESARPATSPARDAPGSEAAVATRAEPVRDDRDRSAATRAEPARDDQDLSAATLVDQVARGMDALGTDDEVGETAEARSSVADEAFGLRGGGGGSASAGTGATGMAASRSTDNREGVGYGGLEQAAGAAPAPQAPVAPEPSGDAPTRTSAGIGRADDGRSERARSSVAAERASAPPVPAEVHAESDGPASVSLELERAESLAARGDHAAAYRVFRSVAPRDRSGRACVGQGASLEALDRFDEALATYRGCASSASDRGWAARAARAAERLEAARARPASSSGD